LYGSYLYLQPEGCTDLYGAYLYRWLPYAHTHPQAQRFEEWKGSGSATSVSARGGSSLDSHASAAANKVGVSLAVVLRSARRFPPPSSSPWGLLVRVPVRELVVEIVVVPVEAKAGSAERGGGRGPAAFWWHPARVELAPLAESLRPGEGSRRRQRLTPGAASDEAGPGAGRA
jgi:hypothetical protein